MSGFVSDALADRFLRHYRSLGSPCREFLATRSSEVVSRAPIPGERSLDFGCGDGRLVEKMRALGYRAAGLDLSAEMCRSSVLRGRVIRADAVRAPWRSGSFHLVTAIGLFNYVEDPAAVLRELDRVSAPRARVIFTYPKSGTLLTLLRSVPFLQFMRMRWLGLDRVRNYVGSSDEARAVVASLGWTLLDSIVLKMPVGPFLLESEFLFAAETRPTAA